MVLMKQEQIPILTMEESESFASEKVMVIDVYVSFPTDISNDSKWKRQSMMMSMVLISNDNESLCTKQANVSYENDTMREDVELTVVDMPGVVSLMAKHTMVMIVCFQSVSFEYSEELFCSSYLRVFLVLHRKELDKNYHGREYDQYCEYIVDNLRVLEMDHNNDV